MLTEDCSRCIVASEASFAHTRAIGYIVSFDSCLSTVSGLPQTFDARLRGPCTIALRGLSGEEPGAYPLSMTRAATSSVQELAELTL